MEAFVPVPTCQILIANSAANSSYTLVRATTIINDVSRCTRCVLGFFPNSCVQLSREETMKVIETKGVMVSSEPI